MAEGYTKVRQLMSEDVVSAKPETTVGSAMALMAKHAIHELPVVNDQHLAGWLTYDELIQRGNISNDAKVSGIMKSPPRVAPDDDVIRAAELMIQTHSRALPVVDSKGKVVGVLSRTDLLQAALEVPAVSDLKLETIMTRDLETVEESDEIDPVEHRLRNLHIKQMLVVDQAGRLKGVITQEGVAQALHKENPKSGSGHSDHQGGAPRPRKERALAVGSLATPAPMLAASATVSQAIAAMGESGTTFVAVHEDGYPVGIVSRADIIQRLAARRSQPGVLVQVSGLNERVDNATLEQLYSKAQSSLKKISTEFRIEFLSLHFKTYKEKRQGDVKYSLTAHLATEREFLVAKADAWDILRVADEALDTLERRTRDAKDMRLERRKGGARRATAFYM
jgi:CBS domain-containing protein